jgi:hypothetical protein
MVGRMGLTDMAEIRLIVGHGPVYRVFDPTDPASIHRRIQVNVGQRPCSEELEFLSRRRIFSQWS